MSPTRPHLRALMFVFTCALTSAQISTYAQDAKSVTASSDSQSTGRMQEDSMLASRAIAALEQLRRDVIVYRTPGELDGHRRLARVPFHTFVAKLDQLTFEVESILSQLSDVKLRNHLRNSLYSYRDGAFWWARIDQPRVVTTATVHLGFRTTTPAEQFFAATVSSTVVIHWRHADTYLQRASRLIAKRYGTGSPAHNVLVSRANEASTR